MTKPTPAEVTAYAKSIGFDLDGEYFCDFYESRGWKYGKTKIECWKACVRTWQKRSNKKKEVQVQEEWEKAILG